jgi:hypothetical protein
MGSEAFDDGIAGGERENKWLVGRRLKAGAD